MKFCAKIYLNTSHGLKTFVFTIDYCIGCEQFELLKSVEICKLIKKETSSTVNYPIIFSSNVARVINL